MPSKRNRDGAKQALANLRVFIVSLLLGWLRPAESGSVTDWRFDTPPNPKAVTNVDETWSFYLFPYIQSV
jgi:hypothetical protein